MRWLLDYLSRPDEPKILRWLPVALVVLAPLYVYAAKAHTATFNHDILRNDQKVYVRIAQKLRATDYAYFTPRQRTPGFSCMLAPFWKPEYEKPGEEDNLETWWAAAKTINIGLSVVLLAGLAVFFCRLAGPVGGTMLALAVGFLLYVFRSGYTQPEVLYWSLKVLAFYLLLRMLVAPTWTLGVVAGVVSGAAFFVKAGTQPLMLLFVASFALKLLWDRFHRKKPFAWKPLLQGALVPVVFVAVLSPYLNGSRKVFGEPFYSTYSKYIMWVNMEDKDEMYAVMKARAATEPITETDFQREWLALKKDPTLEPPKLPTLARCLEENSFWELLGRAFAGLHPNHKRMERYYPSAYLFLKWLLLAAIVVAVWNRRQLLPLARKFLPVVLYVAGFFVGYLLLYGWYDGLKIGVRLMLSLYLPAVFVLMVFIQKFGRDLAFDWKGRRIHALRVIHTALALLLAWKIPAVLIHELYKNYSGA